MNADQLLVHYEQIADAPDAIVRLRRFILDLAMRGKLVEQDPTDEPASELLKRIAVEKARLAKAGKIRKPKLLPEIEEHPYVLPPSWRWTRMRQVTSDRGQAVPDAPFTYIDVTAIDKENGFVSDPKVLQANEAPSRARKIVRQGDVIYSCVRPYLLNVAIVDADFDPAPIASTAFAILNGHGLVLPRYLWIVLRSPFMVECVEQDMRGQAYPAINDSDFSVLPFPLPPLTEQDRIVAKVDELMALCDRLEAARAEREATRDRLAAASLARLNAPDPDAAAFQTHATFALDNLAPLTNRPDQIKALRQTILNLAVRGKLVEQDPADEPASVLLERIGEEKTEIARNIGFKLKKPIPRDIRFDEVTLPSGWVWSQLDELAWKITDGDHQTPKREERGRYLLSARNVLDGQIDVSNVDFVGEAEFERMRLRCDPNRFDILISCSGSVGRVAIVDKDYAYVLVRSAALVKLTSGEELSGFIQKALISDILKDQIGVRSKAAAQPNLFLGQIRQLMLPLPPLAEQHRIVAKVDELMALCDRLEAALVNADATRQRLLEALLHESLAPVDIKELEAAE